MMLAGFDPAYSKQVGTIAVSFTGLYLLFKFYVMKLEDEKRMDLWAMFLIPFVIPTLIGFVVALLQYYFEIYGKNEHASILKTCIWYISTSITTVFCFGLWMSYVNRKENYIGRVNKGKGRAFSPSSTKCLSFPGFLFLGLLSICSSLGRKPRKILRIVGGEW